MRNVTCCRCETPFETKRKNGVHCPECLVHRANKRRQVTTNRCEKCNVVIPPRVGKPPKFCDACRAPEVVTCCLCGVEHHRFGGRDYPYCRDCSKDRIRDVRRDSALRHKYGLSLDEYLTLLAIQGNRCGGCERPIRAGWQDVSRGVIACVDHCHGTKQIRGLLCGNCNTGIGLLGDNLEGVLKLARYLKGVDSIHMENKMDKDI